MFPSSPNALQIVRSGERDEIASLQRRLEGKIRIISPAIDMIELIAARGNTSLDSAVTLTKTIRCDIQALGMRLAKAATEEERLKRSTSKARAQSQIDMELKGIIADIKTLLSRIEDAVPLINLAITTSGVNLSTALPSTVSPSRLLQASTFLSAGDSQYIMSPSQPVQIGPVFVLSLYMLFAGHANRPHDEESIRETTWKEVIHKARIKILRVPLNDISNLPSEPRKEHSWPTNGIDSLADDGSLPTSVPSEGKAYEFAYQLLIIEDLDDDRVHTFDDDEEQPGPFDDVLLAGIREVIPIHEVSKIFYADTGKILNIGVDGETNNPVLLLKRDVNAIPPRRMVDRRFMEADSDEDENSDEDAGPEGQLRRESSVSPEQAATPRNERVETADCWRFPHDLDPEWVAFEVYTEEPETDDGEDTESLTEAPPAYPTPPSRPAAMSPLTSSLSELSLQSSPNTTTAPSSPATSQVVPAPKAAPLTPAHHSTAISPIPALRTSLSLLELLIRLTALQQFQQSSHLTITDELLNFFLSESSTTGAGADSEYRQRVRRDARRRVGFDPYDESPIKLHGEEYQYQRSRARYDGESDYHDDNRFDSEAGYTPPPPTPPPGRTSSPVWRYGSAASPSSPSPSLRRAVQERGVRAKSAADVTQGRDSGYAATPSTPPLRGAKGRPEALKREVPARRSPLGRSESDSTLGPSPP